MWHRSPQPLPRAVRRLPCALVTHVVKLLGALLAVAVGCVVVTAAVVVVASAQPDPLAPPPPPQSYTFLIDGRGTAATATCALLDAAAHPSPYGSAGHLYDCRVGAGSAGWAEGVMTVTGLSADHLIAEDTGGRKMDCSSTTSGTWVCQTFRGA